MRRECFRAGAIPGEKHVIYWHNLQTYCCEVEVEGIPRTKCSTLAIRGITKGQLDCCWMQEELNDQLVVVSSRQFQL
jgi:hypothetical protein